MKCSLRSASVYEFFPRPRCVIVFASFAAIIGANVSIHRGFQVIGSYVSRATCSAPLASAARRSVHELYVIRFAFTPCRRSTSMYAPTIVVFLGSTLNPTTPMLIENAAPVGVSRQPSPFRSRYPAVSRAWAPAKGFVS